MSEYEIPADEPEPLTEAQRQVLAVDGLLLEVNNGGFEQYFSSVAADLVADALSGLDLIGAADAAKVLRAALAALACGDPASRAAREKALAKAGLDAFDALDNEFWAIDEDVVLASLRTLG